MIYTVTMNPSLDYIVQLETFEEGKLNRSIFEQIDVGAVSYTHLDVYKRQGYT